MKKPKSPKERDLNRVFIIFLKKGPHKDKKREKSKKKCRDKYLEEKE